MKLRRISTTENQRPDRSEKKLSGIFQKNFQKSLFEKCFPNQKNPAEAGFFLIWKGRSSMTSMCVIFA